jgi:predicted DNA-binding protein (MmcQ/YjbR family)
VTLADLERLALGLPQAEAVPFMPGSAEVMYRVGRKGFAYSWQGGALLRLGRERLEFLREARPGVFATFPLPGGNWARVDLADLDEDELRDLLREAWTGVVPKKLAKSADPDVRRG